MFQGDRLVLGTMAIAEDARFLFASSLTPTKSGCIAATSNALRTTCFTFTHEKEI
jgi:hypothetical protein